MTFDPDKNLALQRSLVDRIDTLTQSRQIESTDESAEQIIASAVLLAALVKALDLGLSSGEPLPLPWHYGMQQCEECGAFPCECSCATCGKNSCPGTCGDPREESP